jgi:acetyl-CoA/propionyl-CoA carboxylase, biotin carboxylase, biotin carboxyl carrier protein
MFTTVLIANRGEIARRVIRTLDRLGIASVAVATPADRRAPHALEATHLVEIASYLDVEAVIAAAEGTGAQAIHPGYGFLSENPALPRACAAAGITFVGPGPEAMALMGDKLASKRAARAAGVPVVPQYTEEEARAAPPDAFPLLVKAAAGGGGRGMRVVDGPAQLDEALASARREARAGFGDDRVFIERYLARARHLEVQVLADAHGTVLALGERECSLQRRHQKILEESPSPAVTPAVREALFQAAVALARDAGYVNAGTVEFIADLEDPAEHWFLEMNARLQVEHPVTELVTGLDLVELQLRVAAGEPLGLAQADVRRDGHAIEVRVTAEDVGRGFLPTAGRVLMLTRPSGAGIRVDDALERGVVVDTGYDSLVSKVIAHGVDREQALARLEHALAATTILGVTTTTGYLRGLLADPDVRAGRTDTALVERRGTPPPAMDAAAVATAAAMLTLADRAAEAGDEPFARMDGWRLGGERSGSHWRLAVAGSEPVAVDVPAADAALARRTAPGRFAIDGRGEWTLARDGATTWIGHGGWAWPVRRASAARTGTGAAGGQLTAPMPGQVLMVHAAAGDAVAAGDPIIVLESMKMELTIAAPADGMLAEVAVSAGDRVAVDQPLARVEEPTP